MRPITEIRSNPSMSRFSLRQTGQAKFMAGWILFAIEISKSVSRGFRKTTELKLMNFQVDLFAPVSEQVGNGLHATALEPHFLR
jgi:hypothetical protein